MSTSNSDDLRRQRAAHLDNLERLKQASYDWPTRTIARGEATMANLMQQVYDIDALLEQPSAPTGTWERVDSEFAGQPAPMCM